MHLILCKLNKTKEVTEFVMNNTCPWMSDHWCIQQASLIQVNKRENRTLPKFHTPNTKQTVK